MEKKIAIVMPCFNEEEGLEHSAKTISNFLIDLKSRKIVSEESYILFVDDGSKDSSWNIIIRISQEIPRVTGLKLANNVGHQNAILAGMLNVRDADAVVTMDMDLQDDYTKIEEMVEKFNNGAQIVFGVRKHRDVDTFFKKYTALFFYKFMEIMGVNSIYNSADFRLVSKKVLNELEGFSEVNLFLRGLFPLVGFKADTVFYDRKEREFGVTKFPFRKMFDFAVTGITAFSTIPLRLITWLGFTFTFICLILIVWAFIPVFQGRAVHGWASTVIPIFALGGVQLLCLGVIGEYLGRVYQEVKRRPRFIIEDRAGKDK